MEDHDTDVQEIEDIFSQLATQSEMDDDNEGDDDNVYSGDLPDDPDELKRMLIDAQDRIGKRNKTLKKRTDATHRMQDEIKSLQDAIAEVKSGTSAPTASSTEAQTQEYKEILEKWRDSVADKPETAIDYTNAQVTDLKNSMIEYVASMQSNFEERLATLKGEVDPEKQRYQDKLTKLRQNPMLADLEDGALLQVAKAFEGIKPRGSIGGKKPDQKPSSDKIMEEAVAMAKKHFSNGLNG